jgi:hypothetical protein
VSNVDFYSRASVLQRVADQTGRKDTGGLSNALTQLRERGVARSDGVITFSPPRLDAEPTPSTGLAKTLGKPKSKANEIAANFRDPAVKTKFANRLASDPSGAKGLKTLLHYKGRQSAAGAAARLQTRAALSLAFAHGADNARLSALRNFLDGCGNDVRSNVLSELNNAHLNAAAFVDSLVDPDKFNPAKSLDAIAITRMTGQIEQASLMHIYDVLEKQGVNLETREGQRAVAVLGSLTSYCDNGYGWMNAALRSEKPELSEDQQNIIDSAAYVLGQLPDWQGLTMRGADLPDEIVKRYEVGHVITEKAFTSASADKGFDRNVQFIIESKHGKDVSALSSKAGDTDGVEILFPPNSQFNVIHKEKIGDRTYIVMREME